MVKNNITRKKINNFSKKFNRKKTNKVFKNVNTKVPFKNYKMPMARSIGFPKKAGAVSWDPLGCDAMGPYSEKST